MARRFQGQEDLSLEEMAAIAALAREILASDPVGGAIVVNSEGFKPLEHLTLVREFQKQGLEISEPSEVDEVLATLAQQG